MKLSYTFFIGVLVGAVGMWFYLGSSAPDPAVPATILPATVPSANTGAAIAPVAIPVPSATEMIPSAAPASAVAAVAEVTDQLLIPVAGVRASQLNDSFNEARGAGRRHEAIDIIAPKGTQVFAAADGKVAKLFVSKPGGLTIYQFDRSEKFAYYYAHLDRYVEDIKEGTVLKRGDVIGYVGTTGNADPATPHLHFAIFELGPEKQWWKGTAIDPYALLGGVQRP